MNINEYGLQPDWPAPANVMAITTLRNGGVSTGCYASFNLALHVGDEPERVRQNRQILKKRLNLPAEPIWLNQVHGSRIIDATTVVNAQIIDADASFADKAGIVCAVLTADCLPVLLCSADGMRIAAVHVGWRGLLAGILTNAVQAIGYDSTLAWLGPAIGNTRFEVGADVREAFVEKNKRFSSAFEPHEHGKWLADIYQLARIELNVTGINAIYGGHWCTVSDALHFYSYRRDKDTGRMATLIWRT